MVKKITARFRALGLSSLSGVVWLFAKRSLPSSYRLVGWIALDLCIVSAALFGAVQLGLGPASSVIEALSLPIVLVLVVATAVVFTVHGLYRSVIRYMGHHAVWGLVKVVSLSTLILGALIFMTSAPLPKTVPMLYWLFLFFGVGGLRLTL